MQTPADLMALADRVLDQLVRAARTTLEDDLLSVVLYGSAAEGRLRPASDVHLLFVLARLDALRFARLREPLRVAQVALRVSPMLVLQDELRAACHAFPDKFADLARRRRVLYGADVLEEITPTRAASVARLGQILLNHALRLRRGYALHSLREEQATRALAEATGAIRVCAATLFELRAEAVASPKRALSHWADALAGQPYGALLDRMARAHSGEDLPLGAAGPALLQLSELSLRLRADVLALEDASAGWRSVHDAEVDHQAEQREKQQRGNA
jgi:predicted nucleotidyltransferase